MTAYRPPQDCPVCRHRLDVTQLGCAECGTGLTGRFRPCEFCGLDDAERDLLRVFLRSRGNMKELERHLGVSYPTARSRFDDLLARLDLDEPPARPGSGARAAAPTGPEAEGAATDERLALLRSVAEGAVSVHEAREQLITPRNQKNTGRPPD